MSDLASTLTLGGIDEEVIPILAISLGCGIAVIAIVFGTVKEMVTKTSREKTRRELAAYVAEGSITPDDAERILTAGREFEKPGKC